MMTVSLPFARAYRLQCILFFKASSARYPAQNVSRIICGISLLVVF